MPIKERDLMGGLSKGLSVIETFTAERPRQSIAQVSAACGLDRATARRCLLTLAHEGYAEYDGKYFSLTPQILRLGTACLATMQLPQLVQPLLDQLSETTGESSSVSILDGTEIVYVARASQRRLMSITLMPGSRLPAFCTSMGRVLLAALPPEDAKIRLLKGPLAAHTQHTVTDPDAIVHRLAAVRSLGYAVNDQEVEIGLQSIAIPIFNLRHQTVAAMNIGLAVQPDGTEALVRRYLPAMLEIQTSLRKMLR